jgi:hypothetical protein
MQPLQEIRAAQPTDELDVEQDALRCFASVRARKSSAELKVSRADAVGPEKAGER